MYKRGAVWFRNDLRIRDHQALSQAIAECEHVIGLYFIQSDKWNTNSLGFPSIGIHRTRFLIESLQDLKNTFLELGSDLLIVRGSYKESLSSICQELDIEKIYLSHEYAQEEYEEELNAQQLLKTDGVEFESFHQSSLIHLDDLPFDLYDLPDVFTQFRKQVEKQFHVRSELPAPIKINGFSVPHSHVPTLSIFECNNDPSPNTAGVFKGGEQNGLDRLNDYLWHHRSIIHYKETRNESLGIDYSSKFSVWLAFGCLSPRTIFWQVRKFEQEIVKNDSTYWMIFELLWRDYFRWVSLKYGNKIFLINGIRSESNAVRKNPALFKKWMEGKTGIPFLDAHLLELKETGFMSNRGRQNVASFLVKDLSLDWRWGARWFESQLIDYDVYSNWCNWMYIAGVGNDPRENRYFNIYSQALRYDPTGEYVKSKFPELNHLSGEEVHLPTVFAPSKKIPERFKEPVIDVQGWL